MLLLPAAAVTLCLLAVLYLVGLIAYTSAVSTYLMLLIQSLSWLALLRTSSLIAKCFTVLNGNLEKLLK